MTRPIYAIPTRISTPKFEVLEVPVYSLDDVEKFHCAKYVRLASHELFAKTWQPMPAWELRNHLTNQPFDARELLPGMIVGAFNPHSNYNVEQRPYTHVLLYLGQQDHKKLFAEQWGANTRICTLEQMLHNTDPKEILQP